MTSESAVKTLLDSMYASFSSGDPTAWEDSLGDDAVCIGTDEAEFWHGRSPMVSALTAQLKEMSDAGISLTAGSPIISDRDAFALVADRPTITLADGSSAALRVTMVVSGEPGSLVVEQMHMSAPAPNEELIRETLTV